MTRLDLIQPDEATGTTKELLHELESRFRCPRWAVVQRGAHSLPEVSRCLSEGLGMECGAGLAQASK